MLKWTLAIWGVLAVLLLVVPYLWAATRVGGASLGIPLRYFSVSSAPPPVGDSSQFSALALCGNLVIYLAVATALAWVARRFHG